jgi:hypothetical protein
MESSTPRSPIVGSWSVAVDARGTLASYLFTFTADSCLTVSGPPTFLQDSEDPQTVAGATLVSGGHGAWQNNARGGIDLTFVRLVSDATGVDLGCRVTNAELALDAAGATWNGYYITQIITSGVETSTFGDGVLTAERIDAEPPLGGGALGKGTTP